MNNISTTQKEFIDFLVKSGVLTFGSFTLKSGRVAPYFINLGNFNNAERIAKLGQFYANHIADLNLEKIDIIFGPAYKGIPLAISTCIAMQQLHQKNCGYSFDRKEVKAHGDGGKIVGTQITDGVRILIVEDVITAGTTLKEIVPFLRKLANVTIEGVVVSVDRQEKIGDKEKLSANSATTELSRELSIKILPIVSISQIISYLSVENSSGLTLTSDMLSNIHKYQEIYCAKS